jgi:16S rRNA (cytidine1402-2'-O)-methyltransferase
VAERYQFVGFLPRGAKALADLWEELSSWHWPAVAFESPHRLQATLRSLAAADAARPVAVCRELTKRFEEVAREIDEGAALAAVAELVEAGLPRKRAAELVARLTGAARNRLYRGSL